MNGEFNETDGSVGSNSQYRLIVPDNSAPTYLHVHAMGAASNFYEDVYYILNGDRNKDTAYLLLDDASGDTAANSAVGYAQLIQELSAKYNIPASNISIAAFSRGSNVGATTYAELVEAGFEVPYYVHMSANSTNLVVEDYKRVAEVYKNSSNPPPFIYINDSTNNADRNLTNALSQWPGDVIELKNFEGFGGSHSCDYQYIVNNLTGFLNGTSTLENFDGYQYVKVYTLDANGNRVEKTFATQEEFEEYFLKYRDSMNVIGSSTNYSPITFNIDEYEKIQSDDTVLQGYVDGIRNNLKIEASVHSYNSTTMVPSEESEVVHKFLEGTQSLFGIIESDTAYLLKMGLALKEMDANLAAKGMEIDDVPSKEGGSSGWEIAGNFVKNIWAGVLFGAMTGSIIPGVGTAAGAVVGAIAGVVTSLIQLFTSSSSNKTVTVNENIDPIDFETRKEIASDSASPEAP